MKFVLRYVKNRAMHDGMDDILAWHYDRNGMLSVRISMWVYIMMMHNDKASVKVCLQLSR